MEIKLESLILEINLIKSDKNLQNVKGLLKVHMTIQNNGPWFSW